MENSPNLFVFETDRFKLSIIKSEDVDDVFETMNDPNTANIISFLKWPMTIEQANQWCQKSIKGLQELNEFLFIARSKIDSSPVGCISLHLEEDKKTGEVGYWISQNWQRRGCASELLEGMIHFAFDSCDLHKLLATAALENPISLRVLEKQGFKIIGKEDIPTAKKTVLSCHLLELKNKSNRPSQ